MKKQELALSAQAPIFIIINRKLEKCCRTTVKISEKCGKNSVKSWKNVVNIC